jgi:hypothetical protein
MNGKTKKKQESLNRKGQMRRKKSKYRSAKPTPRLKKRTHRRNIFGFCLISTYGETEKTLEKMYKRDKAIGDSS